MGRNAVPCGRATLAFLPSSDWGTYRGLGAPEAGGAQLLQCQSLGPDFLVQTASLPKLGCPREKDGPRDKVRPRPTCCPAEARVSGTERGVHTAAWPKGATVVCTPQQLSPDVTQPSISLWVGQMSTYPWAVKKKGKCNSPVGSQTGTGREFGEVSTVQQIPDRQTDFPRIFPSSTSSCPSPVSPFPPLSTSPLSSLPPFLLSLCSFSHIPHHPQNIPAQHDTAHFMIMK